MPDEEEQQTLVSTCKVELGEEVDTITIEMQLPPGEGTHFASHFASFMKWFTEHAGADFEADAFTDEGWTH